jgi:hypothetical protein
MLTGNCQGYAKGRQIAINPLVQMPAKTTFHELAHIELGHTSEAVHDSETLPRNLKRKLRLKPLRFCAWNRLGWMARNIAVDTSRTGYKARRFQSGVPNASLAQQTKS